MAGSRFDYDWTIMLYLSGDNNLSEDMVRALADIDGQGVPQRVAFTIQYDARAIGAPTLRYALARRANGATRAAVSQKDVAEHEAAVAKAEDATGFFPIPERVQSVVRGEDSANPRALARFIRWSAKKYQSRYRMLILSGHGSGAVGDFLSDQNARKGQPGSLTIPQLRRAFKLAQHGTKRRAHKTKGHGADNDAETDDLSASLPASLLASDGTPRLLHVLGMDSCLMGMAEVCHEVKDFVGHLVGSEGFVPNAGWPYAYLLKRLRKHRNAEPAEMAGHIVTDVVTHYERFLPAGVSIDMAACETKTLGDLAVALNTLTGVLAPKMHERHIQDLLVAAHWRAQSYKFEQHTDLKDFCDQLLESAKAPEYATKRLEDPKGQPGNGKAQLRKHADFLKGLADACASVNGAVAAAVDRRQKYSGAEFQHSNGVSVYFPWANSPAERATLKFYNRLTFSKPSGWSTFIGRYLKETQRKRRPATAQRTVSLGRFITPFAVPFGPGKTAEGTNKTAEGTNKTAEGTNKLFTMLYSSLGMTLPGSMKNPPDGVNVDLDALKPSEVAARKRTNPQPTAQTLLNKGSKPKPPRTRPSPGLYAAPR
jgi:Clostripain family